MAKYFLLISILFMSNCAFAFNTQNGQSRITTFSDDTYIPALNNNFSRLFSGYQPIFSSAPAVNSLREGELVISNGNLYFRQNNTLYTVGDPIGTMAPYGGGVAPAGWLICDGSTVSRTTYSSLYSVVGSSFGAGDGSTTFNLPDLRRRVAVGAGGSGTSVLGSTVGAVGGEETHTLTSTEMPSHTHSVTDPGHWHGTNKASEPSFISVGVGGSDFSTAAGGRTFTESGITTSTSTTGISIASAGSGGAHNVIQPSVIVNFIIKY